MNSPDSDAPLNDFSRTLLDSIQEAIKILDGDLNIIYANKAAADMCGKRPDQIIGRKCCDIYHDGKECENCVARKTLSTHSPVRELRRLTLIDGEEMTVEVSGFPFLDDYGLVVEIIKDVTYIDQLQRRVMENEKYRLIKKLARGFAHEMRNPPSAIMAATRLLREHKDELSGDEYETLTKTIEMETRKMQKLLSQFIAFSRLSPRCFQSVDLNDVVRDSAKVLSYSASQGRLINIILSLCDFPLIVRVDASQIQEAILHIAMNGIQAMKSGGKLIFRSGRTGGMAWVSIADTGEGMSKEALAEAFEPFVTSRPNGIGLGLSIAKRIVDEHNGSLVGESEPKIGSTFTLSIPIQTEACQNE